LGQQFDLRRNVRDVQVLDCRLGLHRRNSQQADERGERYTFHVCPPQVPPARTACRFD
jgi:hypothetical protein